MSYKITLLPGEPILVAEFGSDFNLSKEQTDANREFFAILDGATEKLWLIIDLSKVVFSFNDIIEGASSSTRGERPPLRHPQVKHIVIVSQDSMTRLATKGLRTATFGNINIAVADTLEDALALARGGGQT